MSKEQVDRETAASARSLVNTSRYLARSAISRGEVIEAKRLLDQADWYEGYADRLEARIKEMDNDE